MDSIFFNTTTLQKRESLKKETEKAVQQTNTTDGYLTDLDYTEERRTWTSDKEALLNPRVYNSIHKDTVSKIAGSFTSADYLTSIGNNLLSYLDKELTSIESGLSKVEHGLDSISNLNREKDLISDVWSLLWHDEDITYKPTEKNQLNNTYPLGTTVIGNNLFLGRVSEYSVYSRVVPGLLNISNYIGGDIVTDFVKTRYTGFSPIHITVTTPNISEKKLSYIPWVSNSSGEGKAFVKLRVSFNGPKIFSDIFIKGGKHRPVEIDSIYWASVGNETQNSFCPSNISLWSYVGATNITPSQSKGYPESVSATYARLTPGVAVSGSYPQACYIYNTFPISGSVGAYRLNVLWRGLGDLHLNDNTQVLIEYFGVTGNILYWESGSLVEGLDSPTEASRNTFNWSRFIINQPDGAVSGSIKIFTSLPNNIADPLGISEVEISTVGYDSYAGSSKTSTTFKDKVTYSESLSHLHVSQKPEAQFMEIVLSQSVYSRGFVDGIFQYIFNFDIEDIDIKVIDEISSSRWISKKKKFIGEAREFSLKSTIPDSVSVRLSLRDNLPSVELTKDSVVVIKVNGELSITNILNTSYETLSIEDIVEEFDGTDLASRVELSNVPHINRDTIVSLSSELELLHSNLKYDPNAISPVLSVI